jgi:hypothetical protein
MLVRVRRAALRPRAAGACTKTNKHRMARLLWVRGDPVVGAWGTHRSKAAAHGPPHQLRWPGPERQGPLICSTRALLWPAVFIVGGSRSAAVLPHVASRGAGSRVASDCCHRWLQPCAWLVAKVEIPCNNELRRGGGGGGACAHGGSSPVSHAAAILRGAHTPRAAHGTCRPKGRACMSRLISALYSCHC